MNPGASGFAKRMEGMSGNVIREILKLTQSPDVISFAGGLPSPDSFPAEAIAEIATALLSDRPQGLLQYGTSEGYPPLREFIAGWVKDRGITAAPDDTLILTGSQQGIDLACKALLDPGDVVLVERPTYLAALQIFRLYDAQVVSVAGDEAGIFPDALEQAIRTHRPKMLYVIPTFRNPSGETWSVERRQAVAELAARHGIVIVEDDPYGALRYSGEPVPAIKAFDAAGQVVYLGSFSKIISPGLRVGYAVAGRELLRRMVIGKQATDVHTSNLSQAIVDAFCRSGRLDHHLSRVRAEYGAKRDRMFAAMERDFPEGTSWTRPDGGLFLWVALPGSLSTEELLPRAVEEERVAFIPGTPFYPDGAGESAMRLNFSNATPEKIDEGIARLGRALRRALPGAADLALP